MRRRERITARTRDREAVSNPSEPYPGTVNQPDRRFKEDDKYDNYVPSLNHPTPDMRHEWQDNPRDDIGFGIPKQADLSVASVRVAANKAVRIAVLLLGEKVGDEIIEAQARDLMGMSGDDMDATLSRFAETQELYEAADEAKEDDAKEDEKKEASDDEEKDEEKKEASEALVKETGGTKPAADAPKPTVGDGDKSAADESKDDAKDESKDDAKDDAKEAADEPKADEEKKEASDLPLNGGANEMDIELTGGMDDVMGTDVTADAQIASLFEDDAALEAAQLEDTTVGHVASEKTGIKKLGGPVPRVASGDGASGDISDIWKTAPDVNHIFS